MTAVGNTGTVLYHFLRALSVKVSRSTVHRLLDTPVGNSMRGISDALDALHVKNGVYQLPPTAEYFSQLDAPFITMRRMDKNPFCIVTKNADSIVEFHDSERNKHTMPVDTFLRHWTGNTLFAEITPETPVESFCFWKDGLFFVLKYKVVIAILLLVTLGLSSAFRQNASTAVIAYLSTLAFGILVSVAILYKELFNEHFMERFCHIGKVVDCNEVIHSKGASIVGVGLGELSLLYFSVQFFYAVVCSKDFYILTKVCSLGALAFTIYSVIYQLFILHKGCMFCLLVNVSVWISAYFFYKIEVMNKTYIALHTIVTFFIIECICLSIWHIIRKSYNIFQEKRMLQQRIIKLFTPDMFQRLLSLEDKIESAIEKGIALQSQTDNAGQLLIVTNPNCKNCANVHQAMMELAQATPISLLLLTFPHDKSGEHIAQIILAAYQMDGWHKAMQLLEEWYKNKQIREADKFLITPQVKQIWKNHQKYCWEQKINRTPAIIAGKHYVPEIYSLQELRYVLT